MSLYQKNKIKFKKPFFKIEFYFLWEKMFSDYEEIHQTFVAESKANLPQEFNILCSILGRIATVHHSNFADTIKLPMMESFQSACQEYKLRIIKVEPKIETDKNGKTIEKKIKVFYKDPQQFKTVKKIKKNENKEVISESEEIV